MRDAFFHNSKNKMRRIRKMYGCFDSEFMQFSHQLIDLTLPATKTKWPNFPLVLFLKRITNGELHVTIVQCELIFRTQIICVYARNRGAKELVFLSLVSFDFHFVFRFCFWIFNQHICGS